MPHAALTVNFGSRLEILPVGHPCGHYTWRPQKKKPKGKEKKKEQKRKEKPKNKEK